MPPRLPARAAAATRREPREEPWGREDEASRPVRQSARRHSGVYNLASASITFFALKEKIMRGV
jgi:hypothetical protein